MSISLIFLSTLLIAQAPTLAWDKYYPRPGQYEAGNYTTYEIKQSPVTTGYVLVGSRGMSWKGNGYSEVMVMRIDQDGNDIAMNNTFTGTTIDQIYRDGVWVTDTIPWDQVAHDVAFSFAEDNRYLITGYRDTTLLSSETPPGLFLLEIRGNGNVAFDTLFAESIMRTGDGNLAVAGKAVDGDQSHIVLLKIAAATGDSLWMQSYATEFRTAGVRDATSTHDFNYVLAGRASYSTSQDPYVYVWKLENPMQANLFLAREELDLAIVQGTATKDVIEVSADKIKLFGILVKIDSLFHPSVGDLEITLEHGTTSVTVVDRPRNSGENFIHTAFIDQAEVSLNLRFAPYTGWFLPEEPLFPFLFQDPSGEWTLTVTDHGTGGAQGRLPGARRLEPESPDRVRRRCGNTHTGDAGKLWTGPCAAQSGAPGGPGQLPAAESGSGGSESIQPAGTGIGLPGPGESAGGNTQQTVESRIPLSGKLFHPPGSGRHDQCTESHSYQIIS